MPYFPFFTDIKGRPCLIAGGGTVALRKVEKLLPYGSQITVVAPSICPEILSLPEVTCLQACVTTDMITRDLAFVIAATDERELNHALSEKCRSLSVPVNVVDYKPDCTFLFPALVQRGELSVGISTGGASPSAAIYLKEQIGALLPENTEEILAYLESIRPMVKSRIPEERTRSRLLRQVFLLCLERGGALPEDTLAELMEGYGDAQ